MRRGKEIRVMKISVEELILLFEYVIIVFIYNLRKFINC